MFDVECSHLECFGPLPPSGLWGTGARGTSRVAPASPKPSGPSCWLRVAPWSRWPSEKAAVL